MKVALITPMPERSPEVPANPGWAFITAGIRWHYRQRGATHFLQVNMLEDDPDGWAEAASADRLVLCGNPRFNAVEDKVWWDWGIWSRINALIDRGISFTDAWAGSAVPFGCRDDEEAARTLLAVAKNRQVLRWEERSDELIARDEPTRLLFETVSGNAKLLPCCSRWAHLEYGVESGPKQYNAIVLRAMPGYKMWDTLAALKRALEPCHVVTVTPQDHEWARPLDPVFIPGPLGLLRFLSRVDTLHSLRLHASVPALALGARVVNYATDSRSRTLDLFGVQSLPFTRLVDPDCA